MKIEYKNIIINQDNISQYRENGFVAASYNTQWDFLNNKLHGDDTIIIYNYILAPELKLPVWDSVYASVKKLKADRTHIIEHEKRHGHNITIGEPFHIVNGIAHSYFCLKCADEISARVTEELSRMSYTLLESLKTVALSITGKSPYNRAILKAHESFHRVLPHYCQKFINNYKELIAEFNMDKNKLSNILKMQQQLYQFDISNLRQSLYTPEFYSAIQHYLTFDDTNLYKMLSKSVQNDINKSGAYIEAQLFKCAKQCINELRIR